MWAARGGVGVPCHSEAALANPEQREPQLLEVMAFEEKQPQSLCLSLCPHFMGDE